MPVRDVMNSGAVSGLWDSCRILRSVSTSFTTWTMCPCVKPSLIFARQLTLKAPVMTPPLRWMISFHKTVVSKMMEKTENRSHHRESSINPVPRTKLRLTKKGEHRRSAPICNSNEQEATEPNALPRVIFNPKGCTSMALRSTDYEPLELTRKN